MNYIVYFKKEDNTIRTYNYQTKEFKDIDNVKGLQINNFELFKGFEATDEGLIEFSNKMKQWRDEILHSKILKCKFDYFEPFEMKNGTYYRNHYNNVKRFFNIFANKKYETFDKIELYEEVYFLKCQRGGLIHHQEGTYQDTITYDFKGFYPSNLSTRYFHIPKIKGKITTIENIPKEFKYGIYNIELISNDENFNKIFMFSKHNHYTHYSLNFVLQYNLSCGGTIQLKLLSKQCLIYDSLQDGKIFYCWHKRLMELKAEYPKNKLVKHMHSSLWGTTQGTPKVIKTQEEINEEELDIGLSLDKNENDYYIKKIVNKQDTLLYYLINLNDDLYKYPLRLKAFLTDYGRIRMAEVALKNIDDVIRIQVDSITYNKPLKIKIKDFIKDNEKSGNIEIQGNSVISI